MQSNVRYVGFCASAAALLWLALALSPAGLILCSTQPPRDYPYQAPLPTWRIPDRHLRTLAAHAAQFLPPRGCHPCSDVGVRDLWHVACSARRFQHRVQPDQRHRVRDRRGWRAEWIFQRRLLLSYGCRRQRRRGRGRRGLCADRQLQRALCGANRQYPGRIG